MSSRQAVKSPRRCPARQLNTRLAGFPHNIPNKSMASSSLQPAVPILSVSPTVLSQTRLDALLSDFRSAFPSRDAPLVFSAPGRTELVGNHVDHNGGKVVAAAIDLSAALACLPAEGPFVTLRSKGWAPISVDLSDLNVVEAEKSTTAALVRGVASELAARGYRIGGLDAVAESTVLPGSGLSSSAALEVLLCVAFLGTFNDPAPNNLPPLSATEIALIAQKAENVFFGKPCGLMDQMASAHGSVVAIDFGGKSPKVQRLPLDLANSGFELLIVDTGGSHGDLTPDYAAIRHEMNQVARWCSLGESELLGDCDGDEFLDRVADLRAHGVSDRAILRALHFFEENLRVEQIAELLRKPTLDVPAFLDLVNASGRSSAIYLQNLHSPARPAEQSVALALGLTEQFLTSRRISGKHAGAYRVHGGGFAGTIQAYVPRELVEEYTKVIEGVFGQGSVLPVAIRADGAGRVLLNN